MNRRAGATLIEVLVAIFVMSLGLMGLLVLFPLGALSMAQAIQDNRAAQAAANAASVAELLQVRNDPNLLPSATPPLTDAFAILPDPDPMAPWPKLNQWVDPTTGRPWDGASYPVYVDFLGVSIPTASAAAVGSYRFGPTPLQSPGFVRRPGSFTPNFTEYLKWCTLLDDISFKPTGLAVDTLGATVRRDSRYSWAYLLRRPRYWDRSVVDLVGVVYSGRSAAISGEAVYSGVLFNPSTTSVSVTWNPTLGEVKPSVRAGTWILDATVVKRTGVSSPPVPEPHGFFYRVVSVSDGPGLNQVTLELQSRPRMSTAGISVSGSQGYGVLVVMENVVEVFEKSAGWKP
jgi:type II secretory pathway pseudopilin PulG